MKLVPLAAALLLAACSSMPDSAPLVTSRWFGTAKDGRPATLYTLRVPGLAIDVADFGATLVAVRTPDRAGFVDDVVLGFDDVAGYQSAQNQYFGCTTGRVCNRIADAEFSLDGYTYVLAKNNGPNHLHGGASRSFDKVHWDAQEVSHDGCPGVRFSYRSKDGEEGYPGNLDVTVTYWLMPTPQPALKIVTAATTDRRTPVNITNHAYWNLAGAGAPTVLDHELWVDAEHYTPTDDTLIPTGEIASVRGTALDFLKALPIGLRLDQLVATPALGYDHNLVLRPGELAAAGSPRLRDPSERALAGDAHHRAGPAALQRQLPARPGRQSRASSYPQRQRRLPRDAALPRQRQPASFPSTILEPGTTYPHHDGVRAVGRRSGHGAFPVVPVGAAAWAVPRPEPSTASSARPLSSSMPTTASALGEGTAPTTMQAPTKPA
jgi:aldose 1-epimerase